MHRPQARSCHGSPLVPYLQVRVGRVPVGSAPATPSELTGERGTWRTLASLQPLFRPIFDFLKLSRGGIIMIIIMRGST